MFFRSKKPIVEPEPAPETKFCETCGCAFLAEKGKTVLGNYGWGMNARHDYCSRCAPPYDKVQYSRRDGEIHYLRHVPEHFVRVTEDGRDYIE